MSFSKIVLYPFSIDSPYFESYAWAVELALRMKARLQLFTTTSVGDVSRPPDSIYHSLLEAHGYYLQHYQHRGMKVNEVRREPCITAGELREKLLEHLKKNPVDIVIIDPAISYDLSRGVKEIVKQSGGVILLSKQGTGDPPPEQPGPDHFYEHLRRAELYKLPENFFASLGQDHSVFNYLRKFFQKKSPMTEKG